MKYIFLFCEGMADEPVADLDGRTPLEAAKTPSMDALAAKGLVGSASFVPRKLAVTGDAACLSALGFDPLEFYTGVAPLEAEAFGVSLKDGDVAFRCDLVTALDELLSDARAGLISSRESQILVEELNKKLSDKTRKFYPGEGYKNLLVFGDAELAADLDEAECVSPAKLVGRSFQKNLPKGGSSSVLVDLMEKSKVILSNHEINRVRIDLKENPANMVWLWGQGKKPKLPAFEQRFGLSGAVVSPTSYVLGLGASLGLEVMDNLEEALKQKDFLFVYAPAMNGEDRLKDLKSKMKLIEDFDALVGQASRTATAFGEHRILVSSAYIYSLAKKEAIHGSVPFLLSGSGIQASGAEFHEKTAAQNATSFDNGHKLMEFFLK